jgi:hypothetical protein
MAKILCRVFLPVTLRLMDGTSLIHFGGVRQLVIKKSLDVLVPIGAIKKETAGSKFGCRN